MIGEQWTLAFVLSPFKFYHLISECKRFKREQRRKAVIDEQWTAVFRHLTTKHEKGEGWEGEMRGGRGMGRGDERRERDGKGMREGRGMGR